MRTWDNSQLMVMK